MTKFIVTYFPVIIFGIIIVMYMIGALKGFPKNKP